MTGRPGPVVSAIVLAGGRSSRFGRDKLSEQIGGRSLLERAIDAVRLAAEEVIVVGPTGGSQPAPDGVTVVADVRPFEGPLVALVAGLEAATGEFVLVVAGDMPDLVPAVLRRLVSALAASGSDIARLAGPDGPAVLPIALRREAATRAGRPLVDAGERRLRSLSATLRGTVVSRAEWLIDDPAGATLRDIDEPADL